jgi:hypothetical protein
MSAINRLKGAKNMPFLAKSGENIYKYGKFNVISPTE